MACENSIRFEHFALNVADPVGMAKWYCQNLGMKVLRSAEPPYNTQFIADAGENVTIEVYSNPDIEVPDYASMHPALLHVAFMVDNVKEIRDKLVAAGATVDTDVTVIDNGDELVMLRDPWGVPIQFVKRAEAML